MRRLHAGCLLALVFLGACLGNGLGPGHRVANQPPVTAITGAPYDGSSGVDYRVHLHWMGHDPDGKIDHFDFILADHPAFGDSLHAAEGSAAGPPAGWLPAPDDPRWTATTSFDSLFVTRADSLPRPPRPGPDESNEFVRRQSFERWHTFFVRAVDDAGLADATPDYCSFNSKTLAPRAALRSPVVPGYEFQSPATVVFTWDGADPLADGLEQAPIATRWALVPSRRNARGEWDGWPGGFYPGGAAVWSAWRPWDAADGSGRRAVVRGLDRIDPLRPGSGFHLFAVQAMDEAGAVTPVFDDRTPGKNNAVRIVVSGFVGPKLVLTDRYLGSYTVAAETNPIPIEAAAGQPIQFRWYADGSSYGGIVTGYRYGWDLVDPRRDDSWEQGWSATATSSALRRFGPGVHRLRVEAQDDAGGTARADFEFTIRGMGFGRDLLLVDDTWHQQAGLEQMEDDRWKSVLGSLATKHHFTFDPEGDVYDTGTGTTQRPPPLGVVFDYKVVVWAVVESFRGAGLRELAAFYDPHVDRNRNRVSRFNYLNLYVESGGRLWVCGSQPAHVLWPQVIERPMGRQLPADLVHWDDLAQPHPEIDSVGVESLLYKLGVEVFDLGGGGRAAFPRTDRLEHACRGPRPNPALTADPPPALVVDGAWALPGDPVLNPWRGRPNVEIYDMPRWMGDHVPPLRPQPGLTLAPYVYASGVPETPEPVVHYPMTADGQPVLLLHRSSLAEPFFSRALAGFEPWLLERASHERLAEYILVRHMRLGGAPR